MKEKINLKNPWIASTLAIFACLLWGSAFPFIKIGYAQLEITKDEPFEQLLFAGYRFFLASLIILILMIMIKGKWQYQPGVWRPILFVGLFQTSIQYILFYIGLSMSTGIQGSIIAGTSTFFSVLFAHFAFRNDRLTGNKLAGLLIGFFGVIMVNLSKDAGTFQWGWGEWLLLFSSMAGSWGGILVKKYTRTIDPLYLSGFQMLLGSLALLVLGSMKVGLMPFTFTTASLATLLYLSLLSALGFAIWNTLLKYHAVSKISMFKFFVPVFGVFLSHLILQEPLSWSSLIALLFVVSGILLVQKSKVKKSLVTQS